MGSNNSNELTLNLFKHPFNRALAGRWERRRFSESSHVEPDAILSLCSHLHNWPLAELSVVSGRLYLRFALSRTLVQYFHFTADKSDSEEQRSLYSTIKLCVR